MASKSKNSNMNNAKKVKNDEFYTRLEDVSEELRHYKEQFKDKIVFCNCDDPTYSAFWEYFHLQFSNLGLKKLISTHYEVSHSSSYMMEYTGGQDNNIQIGTKTQLHGDGDFASEECIRLLDECDIVVTNPPFSLVSKKYLPLLIEHQKKFLIICNKNTLHYANVFPLICDQKLWLGYGSPKDFKTPTGVSKSINGLCRWFTNLDVKKRKEDYICTEDYNPGKYLKFDNYDAIRVAKTALIPKDYWGVMGVPFTFLDKHNPAQFEIVGELNHGCDNDYDYAVPQYQGKLQFPALLIRKTTDIEKWEQENYKITDIEEAKAYARYRIEQELDANFWINNVEEDSSEEEFFKAFLDWMSTSFSGSPIDSPNLGASISDPIAAECFNKKFETSF